MTRTTLKLTKIKTTRKATATKKTATAKTATAKRNAAKAAKTAKDLTDIMAAVKGSASRNIVRAVAAEPDQYEVCVARTNFVDNFFLRINMKFKMSENMLS